MLDIPKAPALDAQDFSATKTRLERVEKFDVLQRFKAAIAAAVWRGNHFIYTEYVRSLKAQITPQGGQLPEKD